MGRLASVLKGWLYIGLAASCLVISAWFVDRVMVPEAEAVAKPETAEPGGAASPGDLDDSASPETERDQSAPTAAMTPVEKARPVEPELDEAPAAIREDAPPPEPAAEAAPAREDGPRQEPAADAETPVEPAPVREDRPRQELPADAETPVDESPPLDPVGEKPAADSIPAPTSGLPSALPEEARLCPIVRAALGPGSLQAAPERGEVWAISVPSGSTVHAVAAGAVVKAYRSPYTGLSLVVLDRSQRRSYLYGGLAETDVALGAAVACGQLLGRAPTVSTPESELFFAVRQTASSDRWWEGDLVEPTQLLGIQAGVDDSGGQRPD